MATNGKIGENLFKKMMQAQNYEVKDVSNDSSYWYKDIDFIITSPTSGLTKTFEVKYDNRINQTNNLYLELTNVHSKGGRGWYEFCEADYLAYGDACAQCFYIIPLAALKERVKELNPRRARCLGDSEGLLVSLNEITDLVEVLV